MTPRESQAVPTHDRSDRQLLELARAGDRDSANELCKRYADRLRELAVRRTSGSTVEADEVVQSTLRTFFAGVGRGLYDLPEGEDLWALLVVAALNKIRSYARSASAAKRDRSRRIDDAAMAETIPDRGAPDPALLAATRDILNGMGSLERELIELRLAGHTIDDIALKLDRSKRTIERTLQTCRDRLLIQLVKYD